MHNSRPIIEDGLTTACIDLAVGIPSYNEADSIRFVVEQVGMGLRKHFGGLKTAIINADNFSEDGTKDVFLSTETGDVPKLYLSTPEGVKGKGNNFLNLFQFLSAYQPKAVVVVDADLLSITPEWPRKLAQPILQGADYATPLYSRNEYDGTITNHLCFPLLYGLLGRNIRQPIGGDFAFSARLMNYWLAQKWTPQVRRYGVDIFMTMGALRRDFEIVQVPLGSKVHKPSAPKLGEMFTQVVNTLFGEILDAREIWCRNGVPVMTPAVLGTPGWIEPPPLSLDYKEIKRQAIEQYRRHRRNGNGFLPAEIRQSLESMVQAGKLRLTASLWSKIVYRLLWTFATQPAQADRIVEALKPLYLARVTSFFKETMELNHLQSEERIISQAKAFRRNRKLAEVNSGS